MITKNVLKEAGVLLIAAVLIVTAIFVLAPMTKVANAAPTADPIGIYTIDDLWNIRNDLSGNYVLMNDLYFQNKDDYVDWTVSKAENTTGQGWLPIGEIEGTKFTGTFNGQNYTINNLFINRTSYAVGLFSAIQDSGAISNLNLTNANVTGQNFGALCAYTYRSSSLITNCHVTGQVTSITGYGSIGGLSAYTEGYVSDSSANVTINAGSVNDVGGLIGVVAEGGHVDNCYTEGTVTGADCVGGLIGISSEGKGTYSYVTNCYSKSSVTGSDRVGGLIGSSDYVTNCYSKGYVSGTTNTGGLISESLRTVTNSFYDNETSGQSDTGKGVGKSTADMQTITTFSDAGWDIATYDEWAGETWYIQTSDYPHLGWEWTAPLPPKGNLLYADAGPDQTFEQTSRAGAEVTLDGSGSYDPDSDLLTYDWTWDGGSATGVNPTVTLPPGTTTVTLTVSDGALTASDTVDITVKDTTPPDITLSGNQIILRPPDHKYVTIKISDFIKSVTDICDAAGIDDVKITSVSSDEPEIIIGVKGDIANDIVILDAQTVNLRAERNDRGNGRVYTINFKVTDLSGNTAAGFCKIWVVKNLAPGKSIAIDDGASAGYTVYYP